MRLNELFVSYKSVDPIQIEPIKLPELDSIYMNLDRAQKVANTETQDGFTNPNYVPEETTNMNTWKVRTKKSDTESASKSTKSKTPKWTSPYQGKRWEWISDMISVYRKAGLPDTAIANLLAKNALESGWGNYAQGAYNFGNITAGKNWNGLTTDGSDTNASGEVINQTFRAYNSLDDYVQDEIKLLMSLYDFDLNDSFEAFSRKLQGENKAGKRYAEAVDYGVNLKNVYNSLWKK